MHLPNSSTLLRNRKHLIRTAADCLGVEIFYRHENGQVWPGIRQGTIEDTKCVASRPGYVGGWFYLVRDNASGRTSWVHQSYWKGFVDQRTEVAS